MVGSGRNTIHVPSHLFPRFDNDTELRLLRRYALTTTNGGFIPLFHFFPRFDNGTELPLLRRYALTTTNRGLISRFSNLKNP